MTAMPKFRLGDIGAVITLSFMQGTATVNVSTATIRTVTLTPPSGVTKTRSCLAGPASYQVNFTLDEDFDEVGTWRIAGYAEGPTFAWHSSVIEVQVEAVYAV